MTAGVGSSALGAGLLVAIIACGEPGGGARPVPDAEPAPAAASDSLLLAGEALYGSGEYDSAAAIWNAGLQPARDGTDARLEARLLTWLGLAAWRTGDVGRARTLGEQALALKERAGLTDELSRSHNALGLLALSENRNQDAARLFERAVETAEAAGDPEGIAKASGNAALAYGYLGDVATARRGHRTIREAGRTLGDARLEANGLANEAMLDIWSGDPLSAVPRLDTARALYSSIGYDTGEQNALGQLATAYQLRGEHGRALAALDTALALARDRRLREQEAEALRLLGELHADVGDYRRAVRYFDQAGELLDAQGLASDRGTVLRASALAYLMLGNTLTARRAAESALRLHQAGGEPFEQLDDLLVLAGIEHRSGDPAAGERHLAHARAVAESLGTRGASVALALTEARHLALGDDARGVLQVLKAGSSLIDASDFAATAEARALAARAYSSLGVVDSAVVAGREAVAALERVRTGLPSGPLRGTYIADRSRVYGDLVLALLRLDRTEEAFAVADAARSRELLEHLLTVRDLSGSGAVPRELVDGEELLRQIDALVLLLRDTEGGPPRERGTNADEETTALAVRLSALRSEYEALLVRAADRGPRAAAILGLDVARPAVVQSALGEGEVLLQYLLTPERLIVFVTTPDTLRVVGTDLVPGALTHRVRLLRDLWGAPDPDWQAALPAARALYETLIAPVRDSGLLTGARRLLIVPHGILGQIPFAALPDERSGRFLTDDFGILYLPSAASLPVVRDSPPEWDGDPAAVALAPFPKQLPASRPEARAVRAFAPRAVQHVGPRATEAAARQALGGTGLVHLATHGVLNSRNAMFSRLELARPRRATAVDNGRLEVHEILALTIRSPLVFLSGCETGARLEWTEDPIRGTADLTLSQAVLAAGASNVISTLWRIDDAGASEFATRFYENLGGMPAADALAIAQRETARDARYASPYYWAAYRLSGAGLFGVLR